MNLASLLATSDVQAGLVPFIPCCAIVGFAFLAIYLSLLAKKREEDRSAALAALAQSLGLTYLPEPIRPIFDWFGLAESDDSFRRLKERFLFLDLLDDGHSQLEREIFVDAHLSISHRRGQVAVPVSRPSFGTGGFGTPDRKDGGISRDSYRL